MNDLEIKIGYIGNTIVALCEDRDFDYAFVATKVKNKYQTQLSSTHGIITNNEFPASMGHRQMILLCIAKHYDALDQIMAKQNQNTIKAEELLH